MLQKVVTRLGAAVKKNLKEITRIEKKIEDYTESESSSEEEDADSLRGHGGRALRTPFELVLAKTSSKRPDTPNPSQFSQPATASTS